MPTTDESKQIMKEFKAVFEKVRAMIFRQISTENFATYTSKRLGDFITELDYQAYKRYRKLARKHRMLLCCEEHVREVGEEDPDEYRYFMILDSIDGTVNMTASLPFGVNMAFGRIKHSQKEFRLKDIEGVFVADYLTEKTFSWIKGRKPSVSPPQFRTGAFKKTTMHDRIYEIPDEVSYTLLGDESAKKRQKNLLDAFRIIFPESQRRAIDCTGLRMLEVAEGNLIAYGDLERSHRNLGYNPIDQVPIGI